MFEMVEIDKHVVESLNVFIRILNYNNAYEFPKKCNEGFDPEKVKKKLPEFSDTNFSKFIKWFNAFEVYIRKKCLTKEVTCMYIGMELSLSKRSFIKRITMEPNITNMLQLQIVLIRALFNPKILNKIILRVSTEPYEQKTVKSIIEEFIQRCRELFMASLSFRKPNYFVNSFLVLRLLYLLPDALRIKLENKIADLDNISLNKFIDIIIIEKDDRELEHTESSDFLEYKESKIKSNSNNHSIMNNKNKDDMDDEDDDEDEDANKNKNQDNDKKNKDNKDENKKCRCCGLKGHIKKKCPYKRRRCRKCFLRGHLSRVCKSEMKNTNAKEKVEQTETKIDKDLNVKPDNVDQRTLQETLKIIEKRLTQLEKQNTKNKDLDRNTNRERNRNTDINRDKERNKDKEKKKNKEQDRERFRRRDRDHRRKNETKENVKNKQEDHISDKNISLHERTNNIQNKREDINIDSKGNTHTYRI